MTRLKIILFVAAFVGVFFAGYEYAAALYGQDIAELREDYATRTKRLEEKHRETEQKQYDSLYEAWRQRDKARSSLIDLRSDAERLRNETKLLREQLSQTPKDSCKPCRKRLAGCLNLLEESSELLAEGSVLSQELAGDKDAIIKIYE